MRDCLLAEADPGVWHAGNQWNFPYLALCRNTSCVEERYIGSRAMSTRAHLFAPSWPSETCEDETEQQLQSFDGPLEELNTPRLRRVSIDEVSCDKRDIHGSQLAALRLLNHTASRRHPVVLRSCANQMPAVSLWTDDAYLASRVALRTSAPFWQMIKATNPDGTPSGQDSTQPVAEALLGDVRWASPLGDLLSTFSNLAPHVWASEGGKRAALHWDAVDNLHVVVTGEKDVQLVSPSDLAHFYFEYELIASLSRVR